MEGLAYRGHYIRLIPEAEQDHWIAKVEIEVHLGGKTEKIIYRDHLHQFGSRQEAAEAGIEFGKQMIENFIVPASGEGDYRG